MKLFPFLALGSVVVGWGKGPCSQDPDPCQHFYATLEAVPHDTLTATSGEGTWLWHEQEYQGCQVRFVTNDSLSAGYEAPDFAPMEDSEIYRLGWRFTPGVGADGPGTSIFGIQRDSIECLVRWDQPAWIDDQGEHQQSDVLTVTVQCRERVEPRANR
jgi:hypothetical protein